MTAPHPFGAMSSSRVILGELLSSRARLRFPGRPQAQPSTPVRQPKYSEPQPGTSHTVSLQGFSPSTPKTPEIRVTPADSITNPPTIVGIVDMPHLLSLKQRSRDQKDSKCCKSGAPSSMKAIREEKPTLRRRGPRSLRNFRPSRKEPVVYTRRIY